MTGPIASLALTRGAILAMRAGIMACKLGLAAFIGRYLDLSSLGLYGLAAGAAALVPALVGLGLVNVIMRDAVGAPLEQLAAHLRDYWSLVCAAYAVLLAGAVVAVAALGADRLSVLVVLVIVFEHVGNDVVQILTNQERPLLANANAFLRGAAWILLYAPAAFLVPSLRSLEAVLGCWLAGSVAAFLLFAWTSRHWPWRAAFASGLSLPWLVRTVRRAGVIYVSDLSFVASQQLDRYIVTAFLGLQLAGVYFLYWSAANAVSMFVSVGVLQIERPRLIRAFRQGEAEFRGRAGALMRTTLAASVVLGAAAAGLAYLALPLLKQPAVAEHVGALNLILAGIVVRNYADAGAMALFAARRDGVMTATNLAALVGLVAAQFALLPRTGLYGAGAAIVVAFGVVALHRQVLVFGLPRRAGSLS
ncbi:polysaccharide biosynthesis protein [uncultured Methylobacterium sp.]|jgi:O-antigen/teichoic acid export membrane protein|uniref:lipopolysaccharide biosynthesis protein n=1 Tax=uncultured Methylobacterium sp. TaxID=157278 RepID=UPI002606FCC5|nr:polysaccharide biosynthesis protein [uncultured Methylobacterium sp.]